MKLISQKPEEFWIVTIAMLVAFMLAANHSTQVANLGVIGNYLYWTCRILTEAAFFIGVLFAVEQYLKHRQREWVNYLLAMLLSLLPFTLSVTALDIIMGLPELGLNDYSAAPISRGWAFGLELVYLLDNHIALGALLLVPRFLIRARNDSEANSEGANESNAQPDTEPDNDKSIPLTFFDTLVPALDGRICSMEAQEHYILITTTEESRMVLHRFSDAVQQTPETYGMQVHRSHWVAHTAVQGLVTEGQSMKLKLAGDKAVPVSRTFRAVVESRYSRLPSQV